MSAAGASERSVSIEKNVPPLLAECSSNLILMLVLVPASLSSGPRLCRRANFGAARRCGLHLQSHLRSRALRTEGGADEVSVVCGAHETQKRVPILAARTATDCISWIMVCA